MDRAGGWNFVANVFDGALYFLALTLVSQQAVLPVFVRNIGGGNVALGMIPVVWTFGFNFPQVVIAPHAQMLRRKKPLLLQTAIGQRIPWLLLGIFALFLIRHVGTDLALALFFILFALAAIGGSLNLPVWFDLIAKLTPVGARGRLFAARLVGGAVLGLGGGALVTHTLEAYGWPENFAFLFFGAFAIMMVSYLFLVSLRGESDDIPPRQRADWRVLLSVPRRLGMRGNYLRYLVADALLSASAMANAFFAIYALKKFALPDWYAGTFTLAMMASTILGGGIFGVVADRYGHRINMIMFALLSVLGSAIALGAPSVGWYLFVFVCSAATAALSTISRLPFLAELSPEAERPTFVAFANVTTSPFVCSGIAAGWIADRVGYEAVFGCAGLLALTSLAWLVFRVREPREVPEFAE